MAKPLLSPVVGYNHNVRYHGRIFHVQSEDSGPVIPRVFTHLFYEGTILVTRKHEYEVSADEDLVRAQMQNLHKAVMKELTRGEHDAKIAAFFASRGLPAILPDASAAEVAPVVAPALTQSPSSSPSSSTQRPPSVPIASSHVTVSNGAPGAVVVQGSGMVGPGGGGGGESRSPTRPGGTRPQGIPRVTQPVVKPAELKRPPVVLSSSADGVVVQRNVVIGVGGPGGTPGPTRPARIRPPVPYVVREGSYVPASSSNGGDGPPSRTMASPQAMTPSPAPVAGKGGHAGITWDPQPVAVQPAAAQPVAAQPVAPIDRRGHTAPAAERSFGNELVSDKSLDEVILEYLSDDSDTDES
jgi:hypothetical protein